MNLCMKFTHTNPVLYMERLTKQHTSVNIKIYLWLFLIEVLLFSDLNHSAAFFKRSSLLCILYYDITHGKSQKNKKTEVGNNLVDDWLHGPQFWSYVQTKNTADDRNERYYLTEMNLLQETR